MFKIGDEVISKVTGAPYVIEGICRNQVKVSGSSSWWHRSRFELRVSIETALRVLENHGYKIEAPPKPVEVEVDVVFYKFEGYKKVFCKEKGEFDTTNFGLTPIILKETTEKVVY